MVLYDVGTGYLDCFPTNTKSTAEAIQALQNFLGPRQPVGLFHSDAARELFAAAKAIGLCKSSSPPARPEGNGLAESKVRKVLEGTRTIMEHAGMDPKYWSFACKHFCFCYNHTKGVSKASKDKNQFSGAAFLMDIPFQILFHLAVLLISCHRLFIKGDSLNGLAKQSLAFYCHTITQQGGDGRASIPWLFSKTFKTKKTSHKFTQF
jgi:hypothetical protein